MRARVRLRHGDLLHRALGSLILAVGLWLVISGLPAWLSRLILGAAVLTTGWLLLKDGRWG